jgi:hypothetical protein
VTKRLRSKNENWNERFANRLPHVFVGIVAFQDIPHEIYLSHMLWAIQLGARLKGQFRVSFGMATRKEQYRARNFLVGQAEKEGADFLLMIDDDQTLHEHPDIVEKFYELGQPIAGALYYQRGGAFHPVIMKEFRGAGGTRRYRFVKPSELPTKPAPVDVLGGGCNWFDVPTLGRFKQPHWWPYPSQEVFVPNPDYGLDVEFCQKARDMGLECWLDPSIIVGHLTHDREVIDASSRPAQEVIESGPEWRNYMVAVAGSQANAA